MAASYTNAIDCDIHPALPGTKALLPYLDAYWREMLQMREIDRLELHSYPPGSPLTGRADWRPAQGKPASTLDAVRGQCLDHFDLRYAICNTLYGAQIVYSEYLGGALCRGINEWMRAEWLDKEPRLRASIVVSLQNPDTAAEEIERLADDKRFVQVLVLAAGELPLGRKYYWPIYKAAEKHGLPIGIHAGSAHRHAPSQSGWYSNLVEDYAAQAQHFAGQLLSLAAEGVFSKFPELKFVLIESGVTWLPGFMWRFSKDWRGVRVEVPWVKEVPAQLFRDHVRLTVQPLDAPSDPADVGRHLGSAGSDDMLLFATDYPHGQFDGDAVLPEGFPERLLNKIMVENPLATYGRLREMAA